MALVTYIGPMALTRFNGVEFTRMVPREVDDDYVLRHAPGRDDFFVHPESEDAPSEPRKGGWPKGKPRKSVEA